jgi:transposase
MRYELDDYEWRVIKPMLPNKPRGVPRMETDASSMAFFGSCDQVRLGAIC